MFFRRLTGTLICIVIGIIPVINNLFATYIAFSRRVGKSRFYFLASAIAVIICLTIAQNIDEEGTAVKRLYGAEVQRQLADFKLRRWTNPVNYNFADSLFEVLNKAAAQIIVQEPERDKLLHNAKAGHFDNPTLHAIFKMRSDIWSFFPVGEQTEDGTPIRQKFQPTLSADERAVIAADTELVITAYLGNEVFFRMLFFKIILSIGFVVGFAGSLKGRNMFTRNVQPPADRNPTFEVDFNLADERRLTSIRGINQIMANAIVTERRKNGYFTDLVDLAARMNFPQELTESLFLTAVFSQDHNRRNEDAKSAEEPKEDKFLDNGKGRVIDF